MNMRLEFLFIIVVTVLAVHKVFSLSTSIYLFHTYFMLIDKP